MKMKCKLHTVNSNPGSSPKGTKEFINLPGLNEKFMKTLTYLQSMPT